MGHRQLHARCDSSESILCMQFAVGSLLALTMWTLNLHEKPKIDKDLVRILPSILIQHQ